MITSRFESLSLSANVDAASPPFQGSELERGLGSRFTSLQYLDRLRNSQVQTSMDGRGWVLDNVFIERLWRTVKYEEVYLHDYTSIREAR